MSRTLALPTQCPVQSGDLPLGHPEEQRADDLASVAQREENLQAEVHPHRVRYFLVWYSIGSLLNHTETEPEITATVSFDGDGLDGAGHFSGEHELVRLASNPEAVAAEVLPSGLSEGERRVLRALLERRQTYPWTFSCLVVEVGLVGQVQAFNDHLGSLRTDTVPVLKAMLLLQLRQMTLQLVVARIRAVEPVVSARQGDEMVPDLGGVFDTLDEHPVMLRAIQTVFEGASQLLLALDVAFDGLLGDATRSTDEVGASGERRQPERVLLPQKATASTFERLHDLRRRMMGIRLNEKVDVIRQDSDLDDLPVLFSSDFGDDLANSITKSF